MNGEDGAATAITSSHKRLQFSQRYCGIIVSRNSSSQQQESYVKAGEGRSWL